MSAEVNNALNPVPDPIPADESFFVFVKMNKLSWNCKVFVFMKLQSLVFKMIKTCSEIQSLALGRYGPKVVT